MKEWSMPVKNNADRTRELSGQPQGKSEAVSWLASEKVVVRADGEEAKPVWREFPGPRNADVALRVAVERRAYADLIAHAKESLEVEVCGVLAGTTCEDDEGVFVHVAAIIRGDAAGKASTHVTFTQATWNTIHQTLDREYPKLRIVGWYHTHPGFGVEFSEMDVFIQKNFFPGTAQLALVTDPLSGAVGICLNTPQGIRYLPKFWVDGREQTARVPVRGGAALGVGVGSSSGAGGDESEISRLETRVSQLIQAVDQQRAWQHNFLLFCGVVFCCAVLAGVGYFIFKTFTSRLEPPQVRQMIPVAIQVGDKKVMLGVGVVEWNVPDELNAVLLQEDLLRKEAEAKAEKEALLQLEKARKKSTNAAKVRTNDNRAPGLESGTNKAK
jgi:proteasome lid subunit RPN8/RPN11